MDLDRRQFLTVCGLSAGALVLPSGVVRAAPGHDAATGHMAMLSDLGRCVGCGWCQESCREWNKLTAAEEQTGPEDEDPCLSAETWTFPELHEIREGREVHRIFVKRQCMHCEHPACVSACPVGALQKLDNGAVVYDCDRCIGCRYCMVACPFNVPKFEWSERLPRIRKCTFCADRQALGLEPACSSACPAGALTFGTREAILAEAQARIDAEPERYQANVYGVDELGGTSWLYLSPVPFETLGFPVLGSEPVTDLSEAIATYGTAGVAATVSVLLGGLYYWFHRRAAPEWQPASVDEQEEAL